MVVHNSVWQAVLGEIEVSVSHGVYITWFKNTTLLDHNEECVTIGVQNVFFKQQMERKYNQLILDLLKKNGLSPKRIEYKTHNFTLKKTDYEPTPASSQDDTVVLDNITSLSNKPFSTQQQTTGRDYKQGINTRYTFENFIVGSGNELAYAACQAVSTQPGIKYNPLFLYGGVGIGKTHLIQAVGNEVLRSNPKAHVVYVTSEQFVKEFVDALRFKKNTDFAEHYRTADVLIVDDIQFLAGKEKIQEEFFHTFNALHQTNKQIILSSDKPPGEIPTLEERLRSRFVWGMSIDMQNPDFETRCAILQTKAQVRGITLESDVAEYLATHIQTNIRELEGALNRLLAICEMRGISPDINVVTSIMSSTNIRPKHISAKQIIEKTAKHFHLSIEDIIGPKRDKDIVVPRQVAMYILRSELHLSYPKIAQELGRKDHTTAIHSVEKIAKEVNLDPDLREAVATIKEKLHV